MDTEAILERRRLRRRASFWRITAFAILLVAVIALINVASDRVDSPVARGQAGLRVSGHRRGARGSRRRPVQSATETSARSSQTLNSET